MSNLQFSSSRPELIRVGRGYPCPICNKPDWCSVSSDGTFCICMRISDGSVQQTQNGGYLHRLTSQSDYRYRKLKYWRKIQPKFDHSPVINSSVWKAKSQLYHLKAEEIGLEKLASNLGVSVHSLKNLEVGWCNKFAAWSFPMKWNVDQYCGVRLRNDRGNKWAIKSSKQGLFIPKNLQINPEILFVAEGPSDTAAILDMGFNAIGRPNCSGGVNQIVALVQSMKPVKLVIASDHDQPGQRGASVLAQKLASHGQNTLVITPPDSCKDMRAWRNAGATTNDLMQLINGKLGGVA